MASILVSDTGKQSVLIEPDQVTVFRADALEVRLYQAGRGEAIVLSRHGGQTAMLIDGGSSNGTTNNLRGRLLGNRLVPGSVHAIIASHPHKDHDNFHPVLAAEFSGQNSIFAPNVQYFDNATNQANGHFNEIPNAATVFNRVRVINDSGQDSVNRVQGFDPEVTVHLLRTNVSNVPDDYWSVFMFLNFREAWLLFTGDTDTPYEDALRDRLQAINGRAHFWKLTHHGNEDGTSPQLLADLRPAIAVASSNDDSGHELDNEVRRRLRRVLDGAAVYATYDTKRSPNPMDVIVRTDGSIWIDETGFEGILFEVQRVPTVLF